MMENLMKLPGIISNWDDIFVLPGTYYDSVSSTYKTFQRWLYPTPEGNNSSPSWIKISWVKVPGITVLLSLLEQHIQITSENFVDFTLSALWSG
ncbi:hypothetical protein NPIL_10791 [Nephila pilipes]|uniref:Uncharacterized protein n=1 Tax=Nephila pilipes TaxID=299642 RepID=A0A8X6TTB4_NEPPI|nr:hypothetical protein NPIL_10791 [Nephila pilipes]